MAQAALVQPRPRSGHRETFCSPYRGRLRAELRNVARNLEWPMRALVIFLVLLAAGKFGYQEYLFRTATRDAIIGAYRVHAVEACQSDAGNRGLGLGPQAWANPRNVKVMIGKSSLDVYLWQTDHAQWAARYRNPYLLLTAEQTPGQRAGGVQCEYDIVNAAAAVSRM